MDGTIYDEDYFLRGKVSGKSLYENYTWKAELTIPMVKAMIRHLGINQLEHTVLDYGCARGYTVRAFWELDYEAYGVDISEWAILNADEQARSFLSCTENIPPNMDWIIAKDVLEHVTQAADVITSLMDSARVGVFAVVPLSVMDNQPYVVKDYELDVTHIHRLTLATWARMFMRPSWTVQCSYQVAGIKDNYAQHKIGNGFITAKRIPL